MLRLVSILLAALLVACVSVAAGGAASGDTVPTAGVVVAQVHVPRNPLGLLVTPGAVWVGAHRSGFVYRINTATNKVAAKVKVVDSNGGGPGLMVFVDGRVVDPNYLFKTIAFINPKTNTAKVTDARFENAGLPVLSGGSLWVLGFSSPLSNIDRLSRLNPKTGRVIATLPIANAQGLVVGAGSIWASSNDQVIRLDPNTGKTVGRLPVHGLPSAFADGSIWALENDTINNNAHVLRIDPATGSVAANIELPGLATVVTAAPNGTIWVAENSGAPHPHLWTIDPAMNALSGQVDLGNVTTGIDGVAVAPDGTVWASLFDANLVLRIQPS